MKDENIPISKLLKDFINYWKLYIPISIICLIGGILFLIFIPKQYEFTARMQLIDNEQGMMSEIKMLKATGLGSLLGGMNSGISVEDETIILTSRTTMSNAIQKTNYQIENRTWKGLKNKLIYDKEVPILFYFPESFLDTISKSIKFKIELEDKKLHYIKVTSKLFEDIEIRNQDLPYQLNLPTGVIHILPNTKSKYQKLCFTTCITPLQKTYEKIYKRLYAKAEETVSNIILLSMDDEHKERGCDFLNNLMASFNQFSHTIKVKETNINANFIRNRLDSVTLELAYLEHKIENYKRNHNIADPILYTKATISGKQELESNVLEIEVQLKMLDYLIEYMQKAENQYSSIPAIKGVAEEAITIYNQLLLDRQRLMLSSGPNNPALVLTNKQINEQQKMLIDAIKASRKSLHASLAQINKKNQFINNRLNELPTQEREYIELKRQQKIKETIYLFLMQKLQEKELINAPDEQAARVIDPAYCSSKHVFPKTSIILTVALLIACILSIIAICIYKRN